MIALIFALTTSAPVGAREQFAASAVSDWSRVRQLAQGTELIVMVRQTGPVHGYFVTADDAELLISNGTVTHVPHVDVAEVRTLRTRDFNGVAHSRSFKWGVVIGVAGGLTTAGLALHSSCKDQVCDTAPAVAIGAYTMLGFLIGGGIGALIAVGSKTETTVYRAP